MEPTADVYKGGGIPRPVHVYADVCVRELEFHTQNRYMERLLREVYFTDRLRTCHVLQTRTHGRHHTQITQARFSHTDHVSRITHYASRAHGDIALGLHTYTRMQREREGGRGRERETDRQTHRERERERETDRQTETERGREREVTHKLHNQV